MTSSSLAVGARGPARQRRTPGAARPAQRAGLIQDRHVQQCTADLTPASMGLSTASGWVLTDAAVDGLWRAVKGGVREVARIEGNAASALASVLASRLAFAQVTAWSQRPPMSDQCW